MNDCYHWDACSRVLNMRLVGKQVDKDDVVDALQCGKDCPRYEQIREYDVCFADLSADEQERYAKLPVTQDGEPIRVGEKYVTTEGDGITVRNVELRENLDGCIIGGGSNTFYDVGDIKCRLPDSWHDFFLEISGTTPTMELIDEWTERAQILAAQDD